MIHELQNTPVRELIRALEKEDFNIPGAKVAKESTATLMDGV